MLKNIFSKRQQSETVKSASNTLHNESETSFVEDLTTSTCPPGLYCVIDEFITEYDLRLLEEEERAEIVANRTNHFQH